MATLNECVCEKKKRELAGLVISKLEGREVALDVDCKDVEHLPLGKFNRCKVGATIKGVNLFLPPTGNDLTLILRQAHPKVILQFGSGVD